MLKSLVLGGEIGGGGDCCMTPVEQAEPPGNQADGSAVVATCFQIFSTYEELTRLCVLRRSPLPSRNNSPCKAAETLIRHPAFVAGLQPCSTGYIRLQHVFSIISELEQPISYDDDNNGAMTCTIWSMPQRTWCFSALE